MTWSNWGLQPHGSAIQHTFRFSHGWTLKWTHADIQVAMHAQPSKFVSQVIEAILCVQHQQGKSHPEPTFKTCRRCKHMLLMVPHPLASMVRVEDFNKVAQHVPQRRAVGSGTQTASSSKQTQSDLLS